MTKTERAERMLVAALTLVLVSASASPGTVPQARAEAPPPAPRAGVADDGQAARVPFHGIQVHVDPRTGKLREPTPEESRALANAMQRLLKRDSHGLQPVVRADGTVSVDLQGRFLNFVTATVGPEGTLSIECLTGLPAAEPGGAR